MKIDHDVIIIGGGPAGASAALYACRGGLSVCIVHNNASALEKAETIQNFYGAGTVSGKALYSTGLEQAAAVGGKIVVAEVTFVSRGADDAFEVTTTAEKLTAKRLVIATGASRRTLDIEGIKEYEGKGISYCAVCDAFFCRNKRVAVIGAGEYARHECGVLTVPAKELYSLTNGETPAFTADGGQRIEKKIKRIVGAENGRVSAVEFEDGSAIEVDAVFVALGVMGSSAIAKSMGVVTDKSGAIAVDGRGMTNIEGVYAAGDCINGIKQVAKAVSDGMTVGYSLVADLKGAR